MTCGAATGCATSTRRARCPNRTWWRVRTDETSTSTPSGPWRPIRSCWCGTAKSSPGDCAANRETSSNKVSAVFDYFALLSPVHSPRVLPFFIPHPLLFSPLIFLSVLSLNCSFHLLSNSLFFSVTTMQHSPLLWHLNSMTICQRERGQCSKRQSGVTYTETVFFSYLEQIQMGLKSVCSIK